MAGVLGFTIDTLLDRGTSIYGGADGVMA